MGRKARDQARQPGIGSLLRNDDVARRGPDAADGSCLGTGVTHFEMGQPFGGGSSRKRDFGFGTDAEPHGADREVGSERHLFSQERQRSHGAAESCGAGSSEYRTSTFG